MKKFIVISFVFISTIFCVDLFGHKISNSIFNVIQSNEQKDLSDYRYDQENPDLAFYIDIKVEDKYKDSDKYKDVDIKNIDAANVAIEKYKEHYVSKKKSKESEVGFLGFLLYYSDFLTIHERVIQDEARDMLENQQKLADMGYYDPLDVEKKLKRKYEKYGINVCHDEGFFYVTGNSKYLSEKFEQYLSQEWVELLNFKKKYDKTIVTDAHFVITKDEIKDIINFSEQFLKKYPEFSNEYLELEKVIKTYKRALLRYPAAL